MTLDRLGLASTKVGRALALALAVLTLYLVVIALIDENILRLGVIAISALIVLFIEPLAIKYPTSSPLRRLFSWIIDGILLIGFLITVYWFWITADELWEGVFDFETSHIVTGYFGLIVILELTRRTFGPPLMLVTLLFIVYAVLGRDLPWILQHAGIDWTEIIRTTWYSQDGVFGRPASIVANLVLIFIIFGAILEASGAGAILLKMSFAATAAIRGGPAHAAIMASALFGTMSGSAMANVVGTGVFTIPMIKKRGFKPPFAGAVEAAASCSGQVTPPIMAAAAFFVADYTGTPYLILIVAALMPAFFKYISIFAQVYAEAIRLDIKPIPKAERERLTRYDWLQSLRFFLPVAALIVVLIEGRSPAMAAAIAMALALVMSFALDLMGRARGLKALGGDPLRYVKAIAESGYQCARIMVAVGAIGIIIGVVNETGVGIRFAQLLSVGNGSLFLAFVFAMLGSLVLGMGLPTLPAYLIIVLILGPAIVQLGEDAGVTLLAVHLFVFYFAALSSLTPPVALAAYAAAPIAGAKPFETAIQSVRISLVSFIIPFVFVFNPSLLLIDKFDIIDFVWVSARLLLAIWMVATGFAGYDSTGRLSLPIRILRLGAGFVMLYPSLVFEAAAFAVGSILYIMGWIVRPRTRKPADAPSA
ncbi:MAG: TRAP transporter fused permease subunit [Rhodospirillaceae bacterium]|nr:TRAP transporter fused permease subunit [Rhodospirillaceae bacterium]